MNRIAVIVISAFLCAGTGWAVPEAVKVTEKQITRKMHVADYVANQSQPKSMYPDRTTIREIDYTFPLVTLDNGLVRVEVVPTLGARTLNAVDLKTGRSFGGAVEKSEYTRGFQDYIGWHAGYVEASFPYFEHGLGVRQPAGYRIIRGKDGSATVAMNMRFTQHQEQRNMGRYGRYSQRTLSVWVTLRPGEASYTTTYRVDNPNPLGRSNRLWTDVILYAEKYDGKHILYPAGYVMPHGGATVSPFHAEGGTRRWMNVSFFALYSEYGFCGVYSPKTDTNCLTTKDPQECPGLKLWTPGKAEGGILELWLGSTSLFEDPGQLLDPYVPVQYTLTFYNVSGVGRVEYANSKVAVARAEDGSLRLVSPRSARAEVTNASGKLLATGPVGPHNPLALPATKGLVIKLDGRKVADLTLPLTFADTRKRHAEVKPLGGKLRLELEQNVNHIGAPTARDAIRRGAELLEAGNAADPEVALSLAKTCYRYGHLDTAAGLVKMLGGDPKAREGTDYLRGLIAWERGQKVDFGKAGLDANYMRALLSIQEGNPNAAIALLKTLIAKRPTVYRPRLLLAYLTGDVKLAERMADENPAMPEAQLVLELLGSKSAGEAKEALLRNNPDATRQLRAFEQELTKGQWRHTPRYQPLLPEDLRE